MMAFLILVSIFFQIVMDDHQRSDGIPVTLFTLQSIYAQNDDEKLQFEYESGNTNILVRFSSGFSSHTEMSLCML